MPVPMLTITRQNVLTDLEYCNEEITLDCLRVLYSYDYTRVATEKNSIAIGMVILFIILRGSLPASAVEYTPQAYVPTDLDLFFSNFSTTQIGERPYMYSIDGGQSLRRLL